MIALKLISLGLLAYGAIGLVLKATKNEFKLPAPLVGLGVGILIFALSSLVVKVGPQQVGVVVSPGGVKDQELYTGWHVVMPWDNVRMMDKTVWVYTCANAALEGAKPDADAIWAPTKDGIKMGFDVSVFWKIQPNEASWIYQNVTANDGQASGRYIWLEENVIRAKLKSNLALTVSNYSPIEVYSTKRQEIQDKVLARMKKSIGAYKIQIDQIDIREVYYNGEYEAAINQKKLAEQEALRLLEVTKQKAEKLKQAEIDKNIAIQQAQGEAEALEIKGQSITANPQIVHLEWIDKWDGKLPTYMLGEDNGLILNIPNK